MEQPSAKELLAKLRLIEEAERKELNESGPEDNSGFESGKEVGPTSKDDHSKPVSRVRESGSNNAPTNYNTDSKNIDAKTGNKRQPGSNNAPDKFEGSDKAISDNQKRRKGSGSSVPAAEGAAKDFAAFRERIRTAIYGGGFGGLNLNDQKNKGNDGSLN
jgi:hypothetical protein